MLTPSDIRNRAFEKVRNGYRVEEVQPFLGDVAAQIEALLYENADLQKKLEILAEKLEQYREDEDSLRSALIGAQKLGDSVVRDSKRKAEAIIAQATRKSEELIADAQTNINRESIALNKMQVEVAKFKSHILTIYKKHIEIIQEIPYDESDIQSLENTDVQFIAKAAETAPPPPQSSETLEEPAPLDNKIELVFDPEGAPPESSMFLYSESENDVEEDDLALEDDSDIFPRKRSSRFGTLRFGEDYSLTRKGE